MVFPLPVKRQGVGLHLGLTRALVAGVEGQIRWCRAEEAVRSAIVATCRLVKTVVEETRGQGVVVRAPDKLKLLAQLLRLAATIGDKHHHDGRELAEAIEGKTGGVDGGFPIGQNIAQGQCVANLEFRRQVVSATQLVRVQVESVIHRVRTLGPERGPRQWQQ